MCVHVHIHVGEMEASSSTVTANQGVKTATFYGWKYSHYFVVVEESDKNYEFIAHCAHPARRLCLLLEIQRQTSRSILIPSTRPRS